MDILLPIVLQYILKKISFKVLDKLDTKFRINLRTYQQFLECNTDTKIIEEVYNFITTKRYNNDTADMFLYANFYQTKVIVSHAGINTRYTVGVCYNLTIRRC